MFSIILQSTLLQYTGNKVQYYEIENKTPNNCFILLFDLLRNNSLSGELQDQLMKSYI